MSHTHTHILCKVFNVVVVFQLEILRVKLFLYLSTVYSIINTIPTNVNDHQYGLKQPKICVPDETWSLKAQGCSLFAELMNLEELNMSAVLKVNLYVCG